MLPLSLKNSYRPPSLSVHVFFPMAQALPFTVSLYYQPFSEMAKPFVKSMCAMHCIDVCNACKNTAGLDTQIAVIQVKVLDQ